MKTWTNDNYLDVDPSLDNQDILLMLLELSGAGADSEWFSELLLDKFSDLKGILNAPLKELQEIEGLPERFVTMIRLIRRLIILYSETPGAPTDILKNPKAMEHYLIGRMRELPDEQTLFIFLDKEGSVLGEKLLGAGDASQSVVFPREIMRECLNHNATSLVVAHNHPHGPPIPSSLDLQAAQNLKRILAPFGIILKDSIVVGANRCFSIFNNRPL